MQVPYFTTQTLRGTIQGQFFPSDVLNDDLFLCAHSRLTSAMAADKERFELWLQEEEREGTEEDMNLFWSHCSRIARVETLKLLYWER